MSDNKDLKNNDIDYSDLSNLIKSSVTEIIESCTKLPNIHSSTESTNNLNESFIVKDRSIRKRNDDEVVNSQLSGLSISDIHDCEESDISHNPSVEIPKTLSITESVNYYPLPPGCDSENNSHSLKETDLLISNELYLGKIQNTLKINQNEASSNISNNTIDLQQEQQQQQQQQQLYPNPISDLNILQPPPPLPTILPYPSPLSPPKSPPLLPLLSSPQQIQPLLPPQQQYLYQRNQYQPSPPSPPSSQQSHQSLSEIPLPSSYLDIDLDTYNIIDPEFTQEDVYEYIKSTKENVTCSKCGKEIKKNQSFGKDDTRYYLCIPCSIAEINNDINEYEWEESIKAKSKSKKKEDEPPPPAGYRRCSRMAHYKRKWSFLERDKQKGKNKDKVIKNKYALKIEKQCLYCRNFKTRFYMIKKLKKESFEQMKKEYEDENDNLYSRDDDINNDLNINYVVDDDRIYDNNKILDDGEDDDKEKEDDNNNNDKLC